MDTAILNPNLNSELESSKREYSNNIETKYVKNVYESIATHFDNTRSYKWSWVNEFLNSLKANSIIYDIGCGNGRNMINNNSKNLIFTGIDNCEKFVTLCKSKNLNVINANMTAIPLKSNTADAILCIAVFHHLENKENRVNALLEMKRLIKIGGKIMLSTWSINQPQKTRRTFNNYGNNIVLYNKFGQLYERFYYIFKIDEMHQLFTLCGLTIIDYKYDCGNEIFILTKT
jgi:ubiquinone/menaquinone biosynthesis C-methylase UbiE